MNSTSRWLLADTDGSVTERDGTPRWVGLRHTFFAIVYAAAVMVSLSVVYSGTLIAIAWPSIGIAVWWASTCRSWRTFALVCAFVFVVPGLYLGIFQGSSLLAVVFVGFSHAIAGPAIGPVMALSERMHPTEIRNADDRLFAPLARILIPRHVYRLLIASLVLIPLAKSFTLMAIIVDGDSVSITLYLNLVLRDLAGVVAIAGPGIALSSSAVRGIGAAAIREFIVVVVVTAALLVLIFGPGQNLPVVYPAMLPLYWSATRLPVSVAVIHAVITAGTATILTYWTGAGPFAVSGESPVARASAIQLFIIMCVLLSLVVSTTVQQHSALVAQLEALAMTIPDALLVINQFGKAYPVNAAAHDLVVSTSDGMYVTRRLREVDGALLNNTNRPSKRALRGETVRGMLVELADVTAAGTDADRRFYSVRASPLYLRGETEPGHALLLYHDSTEEYRTMQQLQRAHDEAHHLFEHAPQGVATLDNDGMILQANRALGELVGVPAGDLSGRLLDEFSADGSLGAEVSSALKEPGSLVHADRCLNARDGRNRRVALSFRTMTTMTDGEGTPAPLLVNAVDVTERQRLHELVTHLADHDALTGLVNRRRFEAEFEKIFEGSSRESSDGALLLIDLDNFKLVNDLIGHHAGDELLVEFAQLLRDCVQSTDVVGRLGGDEFVIALPETDQAAATAIGARLVETVHQRFRARPGALRRVTASIGIAMFTEARDRGINPFMLADRLLYDAKHAGRNRFAVLEPGSVVGEPTGSLLTRDHVERILETESLTLELQPIAEVATGCIARAEGLVRVAPSATSIAPGELVAAVERAGLGPVLDARVLRKGIRLLPELQRARPGFRLALNLSAQSLGSEEISRVIVSELEKYCVPAGSLVLEVTESAPIEDFDAARRFQRALRDHGVMFAIDDFGAGFDPYRYLKQLDFNIVKIAGEFVEGMTQVSIDLSIVRSIVRLAEEQGMSTVAEYVSDERVFDAVRQYGITFAQGHYIGASLPLDDFIITYLTEP